MDPERVLRSELVWAEARSLRTAADALVVDAIVLHAEAILLVAESRRRRLLTAREGSR